MAARTTIFAVEGNSVVAGQMEQALQPLGFPIFLYSGGRQLLDAVSTDDCGCIVLDLDSSPGDDAVQTELRSRSIAMPVIVVSGTSDVSTIARLFKAGAVDVLPKPFKPDQLRDAVGSALHLDAERRERETHAAQAESRIARLTTRERQVLELLVSGKANKQVAGELGLSVRTVEVHRARVMQKLEVESLASAVHLWLLVSQPKPTEQAA